MRRERAAVMVAGLLAVAMLTSGGATDASDERIVQTAAETSVLEAGTSGSALEDPAAGEQPTDADAAPRAPEPGSSEAATAEPGVPTLTEPERDGGSVAGDAAPQRIGVEESVEAVMSYDGEESQTLHFPGAEYVKIHFERLLLIPGDYVTISDPLGGQLLRYSIDPRLGAPESDSESTFDGGTGFWAMSITGDTAVVTLHRTAGVLSELSRYGVRIDRVARGFTAEERAEYIESRREESICGRDDKTDAVCYESTRPTEYAHSHPVARLLINGTAMCTAWRLGPSNRMITNYHCFSTTAMARRTEIWFNYQCVACGDPTLARSVKTVGAQVLRTNRTLDYTIFTVSDFESIREFGYLELDTAGAVRGEEVYIPQHAAGRPKTIAIDSDADSRGVCQVVDPRYDGYAADTDVSYYCDTESGSSGSPVISRETNQVVALHHFGGCPNSGVRSDLLYQELSDLI